MGTNQNTEQGGRMFTRLEDGRVLRQDPVTGKRSVMSADDYARFRLSNERDQELAMQTGAPPTAKGPVQGATPRFSDAPSAASNRYRTDDRELNVARAKAAGSIRPAQPAAPSFSTGTLVPSDPNNLNAPFVPQSQAKAPPSFSKQPEPRTFSNVQVAAGPNLSTAPTGLPEGSIGYARKGGGYTVRSADGQTRDFADEAAARAALTPPVFGKPVLDSALGAVDMAKKDLIGTTPRAEATSPAQSKGAAPASATLASNMAPAFTIKGAGQRLGQAGAFLATDQTEANPANFLDTTERYGAAALGAVWDGSWNVPEKGLIRQGVEAVQERNPLVRNLGSAIGDAQAQARQREAIAAGRIAPDFNERAARAAERYRNPNGNPAVSPAAPAAAPSPALQAVVAAATQAPRPVATPVNTPSFSAPANETPLQAARRKNAEDRKASNDAFNRRLLTFGQTSPEESARKEAERMDRIKGVTYRPDGPMQPAVNIPRSVLSPDRDASSVPSPRFSDEPAAFPIRPDSVNQPPRFSDEPAAFPIIPIPVGGSRPRAIFA